MEKLQKLYAQRNELNKRGQYVPLFLDQEIEEAENVIIQSRFSILVDAAKGLFEGIESDYKVELLNTRNMGVKIYIMKTAIGL